MPEEPTELTVPVKMLRDMQWMARRYADGRSTYAPSLVNEFTRFLLDNGVKVNQANDRSIWAEDGMFGYPNYIHEYGEQANA